MGFKEIATAAGLTLTTLPLFGCEAQKPSSTPIPAPKPVYRVIPDTPTAVLRITPTPERLLGGQYEDVRTMYPELGTLEVKRDEIITGKSRLTIYNFSNTQLNIDSIKALYASLEAMTATDGSQFAPYVLDRRPTRFTRFLRSTNHLLFVIPDDAPKASFEEKQPSPGVIQTEHGIVAYTKHLKDKDTSVVKVVKPSEFPKVKNIRRTDPSFRDTAALFSTMLATEACQATISIGSDTSEHADIGQELFCNSAGRAAGMSATGIREEQYKQSTARVTLNLGGIDYDFIVLDHDQFVRFPSEPFIK